MAEPWIRVHAQLLQRPIVGRAAKALGVNRHEAIGLLVTFWGSVSQHCVNGAVGQYDDEQLETWASWRGKRGRFAEFIRSQHLDDGRVKEWDAYAGHLEDRRANDRERQQRARDKRRESRVTSRDSDAESHVTPERDVTLESVPARANDTKRDETKNNTPSQAEDISIAVLRERMGDRWSDVWHFLGQRPVATWAAWCKAMLSEITGGQATEDDLAQTCRDAMALEKPLASPRQLRGFIASAVRERQTPTTMSPANGNGRGRAAIVLGKIRELVRTSQAPGQPERRFIKLDDVKALGDDVLAAYRAVGGADAVLNTPGEKMSFLIRDFTAALEAHART